MARLLPAELRELGAVLASNDWRDRFHRYLERASSRIRAILADTLVDLSEHTANLVLRDRMWLACFFLQVEMGRAKHRTALQRMTSLGVLVAVRKCYEARLRLGRSDYDAELAPYWLELVPLAIASARTAMHEPAGSRRPKIAGEIVALIRLLAEPWLPAPLTAEVKSAELTTWTEWSRKYHDPIFDAIARRDWVEVAVHVRTLPRPQLSLSDNVLLAQGWLSRMLHCSRRDGTPPPPETALAVADWLIANRPNPTPWQTFKDGADWLAALGPNPAVRAQRWRAYVDVVGRAYSGARGLTSESRLTHFDLSQAGEIARVWANVGRPGEREPALRDAIRWLQQSTQSGDPDAILYAAPRLIECYSRLGDFAGAGAWLEQWGISLEPGETHPKRRFEYHKARLRLAVADLARGDAQSVNAAAATAEEASRAAARIWNANDDPVSRPVTDVRSHSLHRFLSRLYLRQRQLERALQQLNWFLQTVPAIEREVSSSMPIVLLARAKQHMRAGHLRDATADLVNAYNHNASDRGKIVIEALRLAIDSSAAPAMFAFCRRHEQPAWPTLAVASMRDAVRAHLGCDANPNLFLAATTVPTPWYLRLLRRAMPYERPPPPHFLQRAQSLLQHGDAAVRNEALMLCERIAALHYRAGDLQVFATAIAAIADAIGDDRVVEGRPAFTTEVKSMLCGAMTESLFTLAVHDFVERASDAYEAALAEGKTWAERREELAAVLNAREALPRPVCFGDRARIAWWPRVQARAAKIDSIWRIGSRARDRATCERENNPATVSLDAWLAVNAALDTLQDVAERFGTLGGPMTTSVRLALRCEGAALIADLEVVPVPTSAAWDWNAWTLALAPHWRVTDARPIDAAGIAHLTCEIPVQFSTVTPWDEFADTYSACVADLWWRFERLTDRAAGRPRRPPCPLATRAQWRDFLVRCYDEHYAVIEYGAASVAALRKTLHEIKNLPVSERQQFREKVRHARAELWARLLDVLPGTPGELVAAFRRARADIDRTGIDVEWRGERQLPERVDVIIPKHELDDLINELVVNAVKHLPDPPAERWIECTCEFVAVTPTEDEEDLADVAERVRFSVVNTCITAPSAGSTRYGLLRCQGIVERFGGTWFPVDGREPEGGRPARFAVRFELPRMLVETSEGTDDQ